MLHHWERSEGSAHNQQSTCHKNYMIDFVYCNELVGMPLLHEWQVASRRFVVMRKSFRFYQMGMFFLYCYT